ncbi:MAG: UDP-N-acetylglucosamine 2-epimerase (non-hydrolyzing) [Elusimicrobia bacterium]|nr:UDP-N-acetylglucosamine 2-epimerase (non-hydrolyzing) [Elusimicrobiota bacterium]
MKKILFVFGTRPEAVKLAPVIKAFKKDKTFRTIVCATGQHRQMLEQALAAFRITADHNLNIMTSDQTLFSVTTRALEGLAGLYRRIRPDLVMVQGDTTTVMAGALAAFYLRIPIAHVEAGLRSFDFDNPFPEELNRIITDRISTLHFAPTKRAKENLLKEGISPNGIFVTGNTVVDALKTCTRVAERQRGRAAESVNTEFENSVLRKLFSDESLRLSASPPLRLILLTAHRRENFGKPLEEICRAVLKIVRNYPDVVVVYPVHLNPNVRRTVQKYLGRTPNSTPTLSLSPRGRGQSSRQSRATDTGQGGGVILTDPVSHSDLVNFMRRSYLILTDSGGIQEEAPTFGKPVLILRKVTERPEAVEAGCAKVIGDLTAQNIYRQAARLLDSRRAYEQMARVKNPFGDGNASERILEATKKFFGLPGNLHEFKGSCAELPQTVIARTRRVRGNLIGREFIL